MNHSQLAGVFGVTAVLLTAAVPASAQGYYRYGYREPYRHHFGYRGPFRPRYGYGYHPRFYGAYGEHRRFYPRYRYGY